MTDIDEGRRAARKRATREALETAAFALVAERGYHSTTVADIAQLAGVAPRTFFGHFTSKHSVFFAPLERLAESFEDALAHEGDPLDLVRDWAVGRADWFATEYVKLYMLLDVVSAEDPEVAAHAMRFTHDVTAVLASRLRDHYGPALGPLVPEIAAGATVAAVVVALPQPGDPSRPGQTAAAADRIVANLDTAIAFVRAGIGAGVHESHGVNVS